MDDIGWSISSPILGDIDGDGDLDNFDIQPFEALLTSGGPVGTSAYAEESMASGVEQGDLVAFAATPTSSVSAAAPAVSSAAQAEAARDIIFRALASEEQDCEGSLFVWNRRLGRRARASVAPSS